MLQFNLSKPDRIMLHKRIASLLISPKEISLMSSTDLANEETKESIKIAEKESLEHSILQKTKVPLAKITHKGLQEIEDLNGGVRIEVEREQEEEEKRERERTARLRAVQTQQQQQQASSSSTTNPQTSAPPQSPVVPTTPIWGGPSALPASVGHTNDSPVSPVFPRPPANPLFVHTASDFVMNEPELNLDELINIEEDPSPQDGAAPGAPVPAVHASTLTPVSEPASTATPTGISPFAANVPMTETPSRTTFDLNALWTAPKPDVPAVKQASSHRSEEQKHMLVDREILGPEADDQDFDMFLEKDQDDSGNAAAQNTPETQQAAFNALPPVWSGMVSQDFTLA